MTSAEFPLDRPLTEHPFSSTALSPFIPFSVRGELEREMEKVAVRDRVIRKPQVCCPSTLPDRFHRFRPSPSGVRGVTTRVLV